MKWILCLSLASQALASLPQAKAPQAPARLVRLEEYRTLTQILKPRAVNSVFDGDTGHASWLREAVQMPWLSPEARLVGFDRPEPHGYDRPNSKVLPRHDWIGLQVLTSRDDPRLPAPASQDLLHIAFMEKRDWIDRLKFYQELVRPGGHALLAHSLDYLIDDFRCLELLRLSFSGPEWSLVRGFRQDQAPADYPRSYWWGVFGKSGGNFLLVYRKRPSGPEAAGD